MKHDHWHSFKQWYTHCNLTYIIDESLCYNKSEFSIPGTLPGVFSCYMIVLCCLIDVRLMLDLLSLQLQCCGVNNYKDWYNIQNHGERVRPSCCVDPSPGCEKSQSFLWNTKVRLLLLQQPLISWNNVCGFYPVMCKWHREY